MSYKYGASFNCIVTRNGTRCEVGGGNEGCTSLDYVSNDLQILSDFLEARDNKYIISVDHEHVGGVCELGEGRIVAVLGELEDDQGESYFAVVAVVFETPNSPSVVEAPKLSYDEWLEFIGTQEDDIQSFIENNPDEITELLEAGSVTIGYSCSNPLQTRNFELSLTVREVNKGFTKRSIRRNLHQIAYEKNIALFKFR